MASLIAPRPAELNSDALFGELRSFTNENVAVNVSRSFSLHTQGNHVLHSREVRVMIRGMSDGCSS